MSVLPITTSQIIMLVVSAAFPFAPLILLIISLDELIIDGVKKMMSL